MSPQILEGHISQFKIVQVSCDGVHTIAMTESGRLFSWGCNDKGQLGLGDLNDRCIPTLIEGEVWVDQGKISNFLKKGSFSSLQSPFQMLPLRTRVRFGYGDGNFHYGVGRR